MTPRRYLVSLLCLASLIRAQSFDELANRAQSLLDNNPQEAVTLLRQALVQRPDWADGWLYMGAGLYALGNYKDAETAFEKGTALAPTKGTAWGFWSLCDFQLKQFDAALEHVRKAEDLGLGANHQFEAAVRQSAAFILISKSRFDEALAQIAPLANYDDNSPAVITAAGLCSLGLPKMPSEFTPRETAEVNLAGQAQWASTSRRPAEAQSKFEELLKQYPTEQGVHYAVGLFLMESDQEQALREFQKETEAHPKFWPAWLVSASLETKSGAPETALHAAETARALAPAGYEWLCDAESGKAYLTMSQPEKAAAAFERAVQERPAYPQLHYYLSQAYLRSKRKADAERENQEFLRLKQQQDPLATAR